MRGQASLSISSLHATYLAEGTAASSTAVLLAIIITLHAVMLCKKLQMLSLHLFNLALMTLSHLLGTRQA